MVGSSRNEVELAGVTTAIDPPTTTLGLPHSSNAIKAVGIHLQGPAKLFSAQNVDVLDIYSITIKPSQDHYPACKIGPAAFKQDVSGAFYRLNWSVPIADIASRPQYLPYSSLTGPFSHFHISIGGKDVGRAHTTSFVLDSEIVKGNSGNVAVNVVGVAFDGSVFGSFVGTVAWA